MLVAAGTAQGADWNDNPLRGSFQPKTAAPTYSKWDGVYFGGQMGWSSAAVDYTKSVQSLTSVILRDSVLQGRGFNLTAMGNETRTHTGFGGFLGYNYQLSDGIVLGGEINYTKLGLRSAKDDGLTRIINNDATAPAGYHYYYTTTVAGRSSITIKDIVTLRARAGYEVGQFSPLRIPRYGGRPRRLFPAGDGRLYHRGQAGRASAAARSRSAAEFRSGLEY